MSWFQVATLGLGLATFIWGLFRWGLNAQIKGIQDQLALVVEKVGKIDEHEADIREIRTIMRLNGCADGNSRCGR